jgi:hypothetical protein
MTSLINPKPSVQKPAAIAPTVAQVAPAAQASVIDSDRRIIIKEDRWSMEFINSHFSEDADRREGRIYLPDGQRLWAWKSKKGEIKKMRLVDSLIHNYPVPSSIVNEVGSRFQIYDGRHRMETIWLFMNNKFKWNGVFYKDLCDGDREKFNSRNIPVTIVQAKKGQVVSTNQLADIFIRLNSGQSLSDSDMLWAYRDTPVVTGVRKEICDNARLKAAFSGIDMHYRLDLANWTAHYFGLGKKNPGYMTTSYIRLSENNGLESEFDLVYIRSGIDALCSLYEKANKEFPVSPKEHKRYKKIGFINAFFLAEWIDASDFPEKTEIINKWVAIIGHLYGTETSKRKIMYALRATGAQNLNSSKIATVLEQVNKYLTSGEVENTEDSDEDSL